MTPQETTASPGTCDADAKCLHAPCFQVQLDAPGCGLAHRQVNACAYHVADVIQALRASARNQGAVDGELTILVIEPAVGWREPYDAEHPDLSGFAFSTIPLGSSQRRDPQPGIGTRAVAPAEPEP